ncbi:outer membrane protein transport protein [Flavobacteriaceae bacterium]|nr:outer membrane protein transport protein [Flavobacteriaceae bacterium]
MKKLLSFILFFLVGTTLYAGGYRVSIQGQKQLAMGHTGVAVISSAESAFFNPAGLSYLDGKLNVSFGASGIISKVKFQNTVNGYEAETDNPLSTPFNLYASYKINDWLTAAIAVYTPYGSSVEWEKDWAGSNLINNIKLQAIFVQPTISIKVNEFLSIGGGPTYVNGSVNFNRNLDTGGGNVNGDRSNVTVDKKGISAWGYNLGVMIRPTDKLNIGFNYRSKVVVEAENGEADFENISVLPDGKFDAALPLPAEITLGLSYKFCKKWLFAFDYNFAEWSEYEALVVEFDNAAGTSTNLRNYSDASTFRFGLQYDVNSKWTARTGIYFDESPVEDGYFAPETPRNDSVGYTAGLSYRINDKFSIDASFLYLSFDETDNSYDYIQNPDGSYSSFGGTYKSSVFSPGIGISYKL